ncbi:MAG: Qat anti-phage system QueC-like protein QatC [Pirellulaceae bacterium]|nr:Qat anti-phage system QueC-like protein QatC [Pirellulaceae bacterium]
MKIKCFDFDAKCKPSSSTLPVRLFGRPSADGWASIGASVAERLRIERFDVAPEVKDFLRISLAVVAADHAVYRQRAQDGWTRQIELEVPVENCPLWNDHRGLVEKMLKFLTGDLWELRFKSAKGTLGQSKYEANYLKGQAVALLSGGADSLVGAIDHSSRNLVWNAISQTSSEKKIQSVFATSASANRHLGWTHGVHIPFNDEGSQRARSMGFFAFALMVAASTEGYCQGTRVEVHASENGLISLNPALTSTRIGSASTRTTHPCFIGQLQAILDSIGVNVVLKNEYQRMTKGEMFSACKNPDLLRSLVVKSMSCGKSGRIKMHCGRCVPCIIRRAAFKQSGFNDLTAYQYGPNSNMQGFRESDDVRCAFIGSQNHSNSNWVKQAVLPSLFESDVDDRLSLVAVAQRGLKEVYDFLSEALR